MSRLVDFFADDLPEVPRLSPEEQAAKNARTFELRLRRKRPLHPDAVKDMLAAKHAQRHEAQQRHRAGRPQAFGWRLYLYTRDGQKRTRDTRNGATYTEACELRDHELETGLYEKCWMKIKDIED